MITDKEVVMDERTRRNPSKTEAPYCTKHNVECRSCHICHSHELASKDARYGERARLDAEEINALKTIAANGIEELEKKDARIEKLEKVAEAAKSYAENSKCTCPNYDERCLHGNLRAALAELKEGR